MNARDAMPEGGTITIAAREAPAADDPTACAEGRYVCLSVTDTGEGMDAETLARAPGSRSSPPRVSARAPVWASRWCMAWPSSREAASCSKSRQAKARRPRCGFQSLQTVPDQREPAHAVAPGLMPVSPITILLVDDDSLVLENTAAMLEDLGHRVIEASSGEEGLRLIRGAGAIDLLITDHAMPGITGLELTDLVRAEQPEMRIILASGYAEVQADLPADVPKLNKPFDQMALARTIDVALKGLEPKGVIVPFRTKKFEV